jgi:hypothetical protein
MRGSKIGCHFYFDRMAVLVAVRFVAATKFFLHRRWQGEGKG